MSLSVPFNVEILSTCNVSGFQEAGLAGQTLRQSMEATGHTMKDVQLGMRTFSTTLSTMRSLITSISIQSFVLALSYRQITHSLERIKDAQEDYNEKVAKYGAASQEAASSLRNLQMAQQDSTIASVQFGIQIAVLILNIPILIGQIAMLRTALTGLSLSMAVMGPAGWAALAVGVGAVAAVGALSMQSQINVSGPTTDQAMRQYDSARRRERREVQRALGGP